MDFKKASKTVIMLSDLDLLVERVTALATAHENLTRDRIILIGDDDWIEIYRLLIEIHDLAVDGVDPDLIATAIRRLRLKLTVLEVMISSYLNGPSTKHLH